MSEAMVKPTPAMAGSSAMLAQVLTDLGNNRSYTVIRSHGNSWRVHFDGDLTPSTVKFVNGKPVIIKD